jgi:hypothetical protein
MQRQRQEGGQAVRELRRNREDHSRHRRRLIGRIALAGLAGSVGSAAAAFACSHLENGHAARPMNAVTHIYDGGEPPAHDGENGRNTALGFAIHTAASVWWALFYEGLFGRRARRSPHAAVASGAAIAGAAYIVDYCVVSPRFRPGFERYLSARSMFAVYAALAAGLAVAAIFTRERPRARRKAAEPA